MLNIIPEPISIEYKEGEVGNELKSVVDMSIPKEGYMLTIDKSGITITASDSAGQFYARKTLEQIMSQTEVLPNVMITDAPQYAYRGFMMDCCRHFFTVDEVLKQIDIAALLKLNKFHWHLSDDQGWRVQIDKYPMLTKIGAKRLSTRNDGKLVEGFYTKEDIKKVVKYCADRHIEVIPEIDMPGHFTSAIAAYPHVGCTGKEIKVSEHFGIHLDIACAGKATTYTFCKDILTEIMEMFPSKYIHLGGDEALKMHWINCPDCQKLMKDKNLADEEKLQGFFLTEMVKFVNANGRTAIMWNDGVLGGNCEGQYAVQYWKKSKECTAAAVAESKKGNKVIYSHFFNFYLDYPYGMTPLKKTYNYKMEEELEPTVEGLEAPIWTEYVADIKRLEYMVYPRLVALAERAWSKNSDYERFKEKFEVFAKSLKERDVNYCKEPDPNFLKGKAQIIAFFVNALDRTLIKAGKDMRVNNRAVRKKYGKK